MANPLRKTMVYLGLADEEFVLQETTPAQAAHAESSPEPKAVPAVQATGLAQSNGRASVTPLRRTTPAPVKNAATAEMNEILTVHPRHYKDAQVIAESFRDGIPVIINLSLMSEPEARRLIDFASGLSQGLFGKIERVTKQVFLLSPAHVLVSGDQADVEPDVDAAFFASH